MPPEIADSDAESEIVSPVKAPVEQLQALTDLKPPEPEIDFTEFFDPTQRLSSSATHNVDSAIHLDGTNEANSLTVPVIEAAIIPPSLSTEMAPKSKSKKRAQSALNGGACITDDPTDKKPKSKRSKTYGSTSRSRSSVHDDLFAPIDEASNKSNIEPSNHAFDTTQELSSEAQLGTDAADVAPFDDVDVSADRTSQPTRSLTSVVPFMTTSVASMGQYQSINLDFRGANGFADPDINPFGVPSQMGADDSSVGDVASNGHDALPASSHPLPDKPQTVDPTALLHDDESATVADRQTDVGDADVPLPTMEKPPPKKRGRKSKASRLSSNSPAPNTLDDTDESALSRSRLGTVESVVSHASEASTTGSKQKRKRGKSKKDLRDEPIVRLAESSLVKNPNSELNPSDEQIIGLPKEACKPRPSRSRSKIVEDDEDEIVPPVHVESSPVKHSNSELNLSDEGAVGLPKEAHKPRLSRSRSKKAMDDDAPILQLAEPKLDPRTSTKAMFTETAPEDTPATYATTSTKPSTKKGRKSKVKRAKTSAVALLKKTDPMLSEGEEDVMWMDTKPAPVKLDLPPDLSALKKEEAADAGEDESKAKNIREPKIAVEIPKQPQEESEDEVLQPKKRGRKPKKAVDEMEHISEEKVVDGSDEDKPGESARPALAEKSANTSVKRLPSLDGAKPPTVSPITSPEPEETQPTPLSTDRGKGKNHVPIRTPAKPTPSTTEKGPTKHSPINPPTLTLSGRKPLYRVGLSKRQNIPSLLRKVDREKKAPKQMMRTQKETKGMLKAFAEYTGNADGDGEGAGVDPGEMRGSDGMLVEWEF
jgi:hypothetical protein